MTRSRFLAALVVLGSLTALSAQTSPSSPGLDAAMRTFWEARDNGDRL
jgi:hypothetical protein